MSTCIVPLPKTPDRHLGIEFEMVSINSESCFTKMPDFKGNVVINYEYHGIPVGQGYEAKWLLKQDDLDRLFPVFIKTLQENGAKIAQGCGMHVHIDCRERRKTEVVERMNANAALLRTFSEQAIFRERQGVAMNRGYETIECRVMESNFDIERSLRYIHKLIEVVDTVPLAKAA